MNGKYQRYIKPVGDALLAGVLMLILSPVLITIAVVVRLKLGSPILFRQYRCGYRGTPFVIRKFRTMTNECTSTGELLPDGARLTKLGHFLRRHSLDELPELFNVLKGNMSFVGPRPLLVEYRDRYTPEQFRRHSVRPGITGWAQINGRNAITWDQKFAYDLWYVNHCTMAVDIYILLTTMWKVLTREGISASGSVTMPEFNPGNHNQATASSD